MKNSVLVNGVSLSREQVEEALKELNKPEVAKVSDFRAGEKVKHSCNWNDTFVVLSNKAAEFYFRGHEVTPVISYDRYVWCVNLTNGDIYFNHPANLIKV
jgi:hypothetical protein